MRGIRVAWPFGLHENEAGEPIAGGIWFPDTPENRLDIEIVVEEGTTPAVKARTGSRSARHGSERDDVRRCVLPVLQQRCDPCH